MRFFVVLEQVVQVGQNQPTAGEVTHEVGLQLREIGRRVNRRGLRTKRRGSLHAHARVEIIVLAVNTQDDGREQGESEEHQ